MDQILFSLSVFFEQFNEFVQTHLIQIESYYKQGTTKNNDSFQALEQLRTQANILYNKLEQDLQYVEVQSNEWKILDLFYSIYNKIETYENLGKWSRSTRTESGSKESISIDQDLLEKETLSSVGRKTNKDPLILKVENKLNSTEYDIRGGVGLSINLENFSSMEEILPNIVDYIDDPQNMLGKDIDNSWVFTEEEDLKTTQGEDTLIQTLNFIVKSQKGSIPEFIGKGFEFSEGNNVVQISLSTFLRNIIEFLREDNRFNNPRIDNVARQENYFVVEFSVESSFSNNAIKNTFNI